MEFNKAKTLEVAFYELPENVSGTLESVIEEESEVPVKFTSLNKNSPDLEKLHKKYDFVVAWDGAFLDGLKDKNQKISKKCYALQPTSFFDDGADILKLCSSHYEIAYNIEKIKQTDVEYPATLFELDNFLAQMSGYVFCPFIMAGSDDKTLLAFLSCLVESKAGAQGYKSFLDEVSKSYDGSAQSFTQLCQYKIPVSKGASFTLADLLTELKTWPQKGYTHPSWYKATSADVNAFMETDHVAVVFTSLEEHRKMPYENVAKYEACRFPIQNNDVAHGVIAPCIGVTKFQNTTVCNSVLLSLVDSDVQEYISFHTMLAPTSSRAQAYDRQADDVRFWNAACSYGPLSDMYNAVFQLKPNAAHSFAEEVREYLAQ